MTDTDRVALDDVRPHPENPKAHSVDDLVASLRRFGFVDPVVVDARTGLLVSGHGRTEALRRLRDAGDPPPDGVVDHPDDGWLVPAYTGWSSTDDDEARAALVALNRLTERGGWEDRALVDLLTRLEELDSGFDGIGYDDAELADLRARLGDYSPDFDPVDESEQPRLDQRTPIVCGGCGASVDPVSGAVRE